MTPLQIEILLHYATCANDYRNGDLSAPILPITLANFVDDKLLEDNRPPQFGPSDTRQFRIAPRGQAFVDHICALPAPICRWEVGSADAAS